MSDERPSKCMCSCSCLSDDNVSDKTNMASSVLRVLNHNHTVYDSSPISPRWVFVEEEEVKNERTRIV